MISCFTKHGWILICFIRIMNQSLHKVDQGLRRSGVEEAIIKREKLMESHHMEEYSSCFLELDLLPLLLLCFGTYSPFIARFFSSFCLQLPPFSSRHDTKPPLKFTSNSFLISKILQVRQGKCFYQINSNDIRWVHHLSNSHVPLNCDPWFQCNHD